jgi:hypothetical protein
VILGSKPIHEMSDEELHAGIEELAGKREALRAEAVARKKKEVETGVKTPKAPRVTKKKEVDPFDAKALAFLKGESDEL